MKIPRALKIFAGLWTLAFLVFCIFLPLFAVFSAAESGDSGRAFYDTSVFWIARFTVFQSLLSTFVSSVFGLFLGLEIGKYLKRKPQSRIPALLAIPFGVPTVVVGISWIAWLGRSGILAQYGFHLEWIYNLKGIVLAHSFLNIPWIALMVAQSRRGLPEEQLEAAKTLGAGRFSQFRFAIWPQIRWAFAVACAQVMSQCSMSFALILLLGGGPPVQTLETEIFGKIHYGNLDIKGAALCGIWELGITLIPWIWILWLQSKNKMGVQQRLSQSVRLQASRWTEWMLWAIALFFIFPYGAVISRQMIQIGMNSSHRSHVLSSLLVSIQLAVFSSFLSVWTASLAILALKSVQVYRWIQMSISALFVLPGGISVLVLSLGFWLYYGTWLDPFEGSLLVMVLIQMTLFFPIALRILWPIAEGIQIKQLESAVSLGASPVRAFWHIEFPRWKGPLLSAIAVVAGLSLGEVGAVSFFYSEKLIPLPFLVSRWMEQYRFEESQGVSGLLFLLSLTLIVSSFEIGNRIFSPYDSMARKSL